LVLPTFEKILFTPKFVLSCLPQDNLATKRGVSLADRDNDKVGNRGDVWKHFILCGVANTLLQGRADKRPFVYVDSHYSFGHFTLNEKGQWQQGIGQFYGRTWRLADYPYFAMEQEAYETAHSYLGSWKLVEGLLAAGSIQGDLRLFDMSDVVARKLVKVRGFSHSDGFDGIISGPSADLYLVDPAYSDRRESDWRRVQEVSKMFYERSARALIWYPVFVKERPLDDLAGVVIAEVRWPARGANQVMRGCGMVAFGAASGILYEMQSSLTQLAVALSGSLCLRDHRT
jgi:23S rRNA A2030 N6-methylase RlmJ